MTVAGEHYPHNHNTRKEILELELDGRWAWKAVLFSCLSLSKIHLVYTLKRIYGWSIHNCWRKYSSNRWQSYAWRKSFGHSLFALTYTVSILDLSYQEFKIDRWKQKQLITADVFFYLSWCSTSLQNSQKFRKQIQHSTKLSVNSVSAIDRAEI